MELSPEQYDAMTPLFAYLDGKPKVRADAILDRFATLSEDERGVLVDPKTAELLFQLTQEDVVPASFAKAVAIIISLVVLGEVPYDQTGQLLQKLGLSPEVTGSITSAIGPLLNNTLEARIANQPAPAMPELPPLTQKIPPVAPAPDSSKPAGRNIIDLRKQQEGQ